MKKFLAFHSPILNKSEFTQQDGRKKRTGNCMHVTNKTRLLRACFVAIFTNIKCFLVSKLWRKLISNKLIVTLVTQGLPSSFLSCPVA